MTPYLRSPSGYPRIKAQDGSKMWEIWTERGGTKLIESRQHGKPHTFRMHMVYKMPALDPVKVGSWQVGTFPSIFFADYLEESWPDCPPEFLYDLRLVTNQ